MKAIYSVGPRPGADPSTYITQDGIKYVKRNVVALTGRYIVVAKHDSFWGEGKDYTSRVIENPTWGQLYSIAGRAIEATGDRHHVFFEGVHPTTEVVTTKDGRTARVLSLSMGS